MSLPLNEFSFHFKLQGDKTKEWYEGDFTCACILTNSEMLDVAIKWDRYNAGSKSLPDKFGDFNRIMAELEVRIKKAPTWWKESNSGWTLLDPNIVYSVFVEVMKAPDDWNDRLKKRSEEAQKVADDQVKKT